MSLRDCEYTLSECTLSEMEHLKPGLRQRQKRRTRHRLLQQALRLFARDGIVATPTAELARAAGVSHGALFVHFGSRDELVAAAVEEFAGGVVRRIHQLTEGSAGVREVLEAHLEGLSEHEDFYVRLVMEGPVLPPYARSTLVGIQSAIAFHLEIAARRDLAAGRLRRMELPLLFNTWLGLLHHYLSNRDLFAPGESVLARRGRELLDHYMSLITP